MGSVYTLTLSTFTPKLGLRIGTMSYSNHNRHMKETFKEEIGNHPVQIQANSTKSMNQISNENRSKINHELMSESHICSRSNSPLNPTHPRRQLQVKPQVLNTKDRKKKRHRNQIISVCKESPILLICEDVFNAINLLNMENLRFEQKTKYFKMSIDDWVEWTYSPENPNRSSNKQGSLLYKMLNKDLLRGALAQIIKADDVVESITLSSNEIFLCEDDVTTCTAVLKEKANYPLHIQFLRPSPILNLTLDPQISITSLSSSSSRTSLAPEFIELSDSSDDQLQLKGVKDTKVHNEAEKVPYPVYINTPMHPMSIIGTSARRKILPRPFPLPIAAPDPFFPYDINQWVMTPTGPGKVISYQVKRLTICDNDLISPFVTCQIKLPFGLSYIDLEDITPLESSDFPQRQVLFYEGAAVNQMDILRLEPQAFLNDSIVNFYLKYLIRERLPQRLYQMGMSRRIVKDMYVFPTYLYSRMSNLIGGSSYKNTFEGRKQLWKDTKAWTNGINIFEKKNLIIPVNYALHWTFVLVCNAGLIVGASTKSDSEGIYRNEEQIKHHYTIPKSFLMRSCILNFDSGKHLRLHRPQTINDVIRKYLNACFENSFYYRPVKLATPEQIREQAAKVFTATSMPSFSPTCPSQTNTYDCGVYMLDMIEKVMFDPPVVNNRFLEKKGERWHPFTLKSISDANKKRLEIKALIYKITERTREELDEDDESEDERIILY